MACTGGVGFTGYLKVCSYLLPFLTADIVKVVEINPSESVIGGGYGSVSSAPVNPVWRDYINFAIGKETVEGTISTEIFGGTGNYNSAFKEMLRRSIGDSSANSNDMTYVCNGFSDSCKLIFSPGGGSEISLPATGRKALISEMTINGNNGGNVGCSFKILSAGASWNTPPAVTSPSTGDLSFETAGLTDDSNPIPWYASNFTLTNAGETFDISDYVLDYSITVSNQATPLYFFNGINFPGDIFLGKRKVSGSFTYWSPNGQFAEFLTHGASITVTFGDITLTIPFCAFSRGPVPNQGPNKEVSRNQEFQGFAKSASEPAIYWTET
jgi:hypothetical protein